MKILQNLWMVILALSASVVLASARSASEPSESWFWSGEKEGKTVTFGIRAGLNLSSIGVNDVFKYANEFENEPFSSLAGFNAGISVDFQITKSFYINFGLFYTTKGGKVKNVEYDFEDVCGENKTTITAGFLEIPIYASYRMNFSEKSQLQVFFGPYFGIGLNGKWREEGWVGDYGEKEFYKDDYTLFGCRKDYYDWPDYDGWHDYENDDDKMGFTRFDAGLGLGIGYTFYRFYIGAQYQWGLVNHLNTSDEMSPWVSYEVKPSCKFNNFSISVGYNF